MLHDPISGCEPSRELILPKKPREPESFALVSKLALLMDELAFIRYIFSLNHIV